MRRALTLSVGALATLCSVGEARANPVDAFGLGSRGTAMGGAVAADVSDFSANYYNPAGLARATGLELSLGYMRADHFLYTNGKDNGVDPVKGLVGGIVAPGNLLGLPFAFGVALFLPDDRLSRVIALPQDQPRWELYDNRNQRLYIAANLAVSPVPWLQLGGGIAFMAATEGTLAISGEAAIKDPGSSQLRHEVDADLTAIRYPQIGARVALSDRVALALVYRGQFSESLNLAAVLNGDIKFTPSSGTLTTAYYSLQTDSVNAFLPQQAVVGSSFKVTNDLRANLDFTYVNWSAYVAPVATTDVKLDIPPPAGGWPPGILPPTTPAPTALIPIHMHDTVVPHLGVEWRAFDQPKWEGFLRGGYEYDRSPIPEQVGQTNYIDRDRHAFSLGIGVRLVKLLRELPGDVRIDGHAQLSALFDGTTLKSNPADLVGDYTAGGHIWNVGGNLTVGF
jgi:long-subunit fatty acid transport protein